jgi:hypothetical protein
MALLNEFGKAGQRLGVGRENLPEGSFQFLAQMTPLVVSEAGTEEVTEGGVVAVAENLPRKVLGTERDSVPFKKIHPLLKVERVAVD